MARDTITVTAITAAGVAEPAQVTGVAANDLQFAAAVGDVVFIEVENEDVGSHNVEVATNFSVDGLTLPNAIIAVPAGTYKRIKVPLGSRDVYLQDNGYVYINVGTDTYLKFRVYSL